MFELKRYTSGSEINFLTHELSLVCRLFNHMQNDKCYKLHYIYQNVIVAKVTRKTLLVNVHFILYKCTRKTLKPTSILRALVSNPVLLITTKYTMSSYTNYTVNAPSNRKLHKINRTVTK